MNRETERYFTELPEIDIKRSKFKIPFDHKTTFNAGELIPFYVSEVIPGDTVKIDLSTVIRMSTPLFPVMDNAICDVTFFFCPSRLVWSHWVNFWGETDYPWWDDQIEYEVPQITTNSQHKFASKSVADYMGLPLDIANLSVSALPFRCYSKIWGDWWRDENLQQAPPLALTDSNEITDNTAQRGGNLLKANKTHDFFTSCLPSPQRGPDTTIPLGEYAEVYTGTGGVAKSPAFPLRWRTTGGEIIGSTVHNPLYIKSQTDAPTTYETGVIDGQELYSKEFYAKVYPDNLYADLRNATAATISQLRMAMSVQAFYESLARTGNRYVEFCKGIFGVSNPDARLQRSEYLGGKRFSININTVLQTSSTDSTSPQGNTGAYSHTADVGEYFTKSFTEHGYIIGLMCVREDEHTYGQGIEEMWLRKKWHQFYVPQLAFISEQPVYNKQIYAQGTDEDNEVFGYQEAWASYRYKPNMVTGAMRTTYAQSLDAWHYADHYTQLPVLGSTWIQEDKSNFDRTLAVTSDLENQFIADIYVDATWVRPMPVYSVPGFGSYL